MRGPLLPLSLILAVGATFAVALLVMHDRSPPVAEPPPLEVSEDPAPSPEEPAPAVGLRRYETTVTLTEDLRDALAGDRAALDAEVWRVSAALRTKARWMLRGPVADEPSPRVRALLVLATGVHVPDEPDLLRYAADRAPVVRKAAVLAAGRRADGARSATLVGAVTVPIGRDLPAGTARLLRQRLRGEEDEAVRAAIEAVLRACE